MPDATTGARGPLSGLRVIDLSSVLAGPYATMLLADLGADVVKVEAPDGDPTRGWGPPWVGEESAGTRTAAYYLAVNRNKRSIRLDLRRPAGVDILRRLLVDADVLIENLRPGSLARLGFDEAGVRALNPDLIHLAITGYGADGPAAERPGYDVVIQAVGGLMSITGEADADGGSPTKVGVAISDIVAGLFATIGILAGLLARREHGPVRGQRIDVSLLASTLAVLVNQAQNAFTTDVSPGRRGNAHPNIVPYESFATRDGQIVVAVGSERQWPRFCEAIGAAGLAHDPRFATNGARVTARAALRPLIAERLAARPTAAWLEALTAADVPCGAVTDILTALESPEAAARSMVVEVEHPALGVLRQAGIPIEFEVTPGAVRTAPPLLGEHTEEVLGELGLTSDEVARLRADGVV